MIDIERIKRMRNAFAIDENKDVSAALTELIKCRLRIDTALAECKTLESLPGSEQCQHPLPFRTAARRIRAKLEGQR